MTFDDHMTVMIIEFIVIGYKFCGCKVVFESFIYNLHLHICNEDINNSILICVPKAPNFQFIFVVFCKISILKVHKLG